MVETAINKLNAGIQFETPIVDKMLPFANHLSNMEFLTNILWAIVILVVTFLITNLFK